LAVGRSPGAVLELAPLGDFGEPAGHAARFELEHLAQPTLRDDFADWEFRERSRAERRAAGYVVRVASFDRVDALADESGGLVAGWRGFLSGMFFILVFICLLGRG
jgi:hypothetical protein